jgi:hypothetical protein
MTIGKNHIAILPQTVPSLPVKYHLISNDVRNAAARERSQLRRSIRRRRSNSQPRASIQGQWHKNGRGLFRHYEALRYEELPHVERRCK